MMFPPSILRVRVLDDDSRVSLWIPLILIWPIVLGLYLLLLPCIVVAAIATWRSGWGGRFCWSALSCSACIAPCAV